VCYDRLPIELGEIAGMRTRLQIVAVPGAPEHAPTRKQLLDRVDGIVFVLDARRERIDENVAAFEELRSALAAYGRRLEEVPLVVQYNKQDLSDPYVLEELHRKLDVRGAAVFEAVATQAQGVLQALTTISKRVVRALRDAPPPASEPPARVVDAPPPPPAELERAGEESPELAQRVRPGDPPAATRTPPPGDFEHRPLSIDGEVAVERDAGAGPSPSALDASWPEAPVDLEIDAADLEPADWRILAIEPAEVTGPRSLALPLRLGDGAGRELRLRLSLSLDALPERGGAS
jgi:hypothetical protein